MLVRGSSTGIGGLNFPSEDSFGVGRQTRWESRLAIEIEVGQDAPSVQTNFPRPWRQALIGLGTAFEDRREEPIVREAGPVAGDLEEIRFDNGCDFVPENGFRFEFRVRGFSDGAGDGGIVDEAVGESGPKRPAV